MLNRKKKISDVDFNSRFVNWTLFTVWYEFVQFQQSVQDCSWIMQITFSTNYCVFMPLHDLQVYLVNWVLNGQHAQFSVNFPMRILELVYLSFHIFLCLQEMMQCLSSYSIPAPSTLTPAETACVHLVLKCVVKKRTPFLHHPPSICSLIMSRLLSVHGG